MVRGKARNPSYSEVMVKVMKVTRLYFSSLQRLELEDKMQEDEE